MGVGGWSLGNSRYWADTLDCWAPIVLFFVCASPRVRRGGAAIACWLERIASRTLLFPLLLGGLSLLIGAFISVVLAEPAPLVHDEFSYLLAADTFAHGRLANPPHPMWRHFESMHVLQQPVYISKYPPIQGLALAAGQVLLRQPVAGAWIAAAISCMAVYWMLLAWLPRRWAIVGALIILIQPVTLLWSQSYWGGAVPLTGGSLLFGALRRIVDRPSGLAGAAMGLGLVILANSRPYEGLLISMPAAIVLVGWSVRQVRTGQWRCVLRVASPVVGVLLLGSGAWMYYNLRTTGKPWLTPYALHDATYCRTPHLLWQPLRPLPAYGNRELADFHGRWEPAQWESGRSLAGRMTALRIDLWNLSADLGWPVLLTALCLPMLPSVLRRDRWMRLVAATLCVLGVGMLPVTWSIRAHYLAPAGGMALVLLVACLQRLSELMWGRWPVGRVAMMTVLGACGLAGIEAARECYLRQIDGWHVRRAQIIRDLQRGPDRHLVIVRYVPGHDIHAEWVYNPAEIDSVKVVWARDLGADANAQLMAYFHTRRVWLLHVSNTRIQLMPYPGINPPGTTRAISFRPSFGG